MKIMNLLPAGKRRKQHGFSAPESDTTLKKYVLDNGGSLDGADTNYGLALCALRVVLSKAHQQMEVDSYQLNLVLEETAFHAICQSPMPCSTDFIRRVIEYFPNYKHQLCSCDYNEIFDKALIHLLATQYLLHQMETDEGSEAILNVLCTSVLPNSLLDYVADTLVRENRHYVQRIVNLHHLCMKRMEDDDTYGQAARQLLAMLREHILLEQSQAKEKLQPYVGGVFGVSLFLMILAFCIRCNRLLDQPGESFPLLTAVAVLLLIIAAALGLWIGFLLDDQALSRAVERTYGLRQLWAKRRDYTRALFPEQTKRRSNLYFHYAGCILAILISALILQYAYYEAIPSVVLTSTEYAWVNDNQVSVQRNLTGNGRAVAFYGDTIHVSTKDDKSPWYLVSGDSAVFDSDGKPSDADMIFCQPDDPAYNVRAVSLYPRLPNRPLFRRGSAARVTMFDPEYKILLQISDLPRRVGHRMIFTCLVYSEEGKQLNFASDPEEYFRIVDDSGNDICHKADIQVKEIGNSESMARYEVTVEHIPMLDNSGIILLIGEGLAQNSEYPSVTAPGLSWRMDSIWTDTGEDDYPVVISGPLSGTVYDPHAKLHSIPTGGSFSWNIGVDNVLLFGETAPARIRDHIRCIGFTSDINVLMNYCSAVEDNRAHIVFSNVIPQSSILEVEFEEGAMVNQNGYVSRPQRFTLPLAFDDTIVTDPPVYFLSDEYAFLDYHTDTIPEDVLTVVFKLCSNQYVDLQQLIAVPSGHVLHGESSGTVDVTNMITIPGIQAEAILRYDYGMRGDAGIPWEGQTYKDGVYSQQISLDLCHPQGYEVGQPVEIVFSPEFMELLTGTTSEKSVVLHIDGESPETTNIPFPISENMLWLEEPVSQTQEAVPTVMVSSGEVIRITYGYSSEVNSMDSLVTHLRGLAPSSLVLQDRSNQTLTLTFPCIESRTIRPYIKVYGFNYIFPAVKIEVAE